MKVIIFDLDDTLISEKSYIESGYNYISKIVSSKYGIDQQYISNLLFKLFRKSSKNVFNRLYDKLGIPYTQEIIMKLVEQYRNHAPNIVFYDDVLPCLEVLKKKGIKTGVITDGYAYSQWRKLEAVQAYNYFDKIIVTDDLGRDYWKPNPKSFEIMKETFNVQYEEIFYVADNPKKDFYIGSIHPIKTIRIVRENGLYISAEYYKDVKEDINISTLNEVVEIINS